jgi:hypothetical protein
MEWITKNTSITNSSSAAAPLKTYSAEEFARVYMISRADFLGLDLEVITLNWSPNYIYDFLYHIRDLKHIDLAIEWLAYAWKDKHHFEDSYENIKNKELVEQCSRFVASLKDIKRTLIQRFENEKNKQALMEKMLEGYNSTTTTAEIEPLVACSDPIKTESPQFTQQTVPQGYPTNTAYNILIKNLPEEVQKCVIVSQPVFNILVKQLNEDTWCIVEKNKGKYCDALRFVCNCHHILSRNTTRGVFDDFLHAVVEKVKDAPSLMSSLSRRKDTSSSKINRSYMCYSSPVPSRREEVWQLINDCKPLEESLQPVLDAMNAHRDCLSVKNQQVF